MGSLRRSIVSSAAASLCVCTEIFCRARAKWNGGPSKKLSFFGWRGSVEHQRRKNVSVSRESWVPAVVRMEGIRGGVSEEGEIGFVSNRLLVVPCCAQESKTLDSFSKCSEAGVVSNMGYFRAWSWVVGFVQCMVSGVGIFTCHCKNRLMAPSRGKQQQLNALGVRANRV